MTVDNEPVVEPDDGKITLLCSIIKNSTYRGKKFIQQELNREIHYIERQKKKQNTIKEILTLFRNKFIL